MKSFIVVNCLGVPDPLGSTVKSGNWPPLCVRSKTIVEPSGENAGSSSCSLAAGDVTVWRPDPSSRVTEMRQGVAVQSSNATCVPSGEKFGLKSDPADPGIAVGLPPLGVIRVRTPLRSNTIFVPSGENSGRAPVPPVVSACGFDPSTPMIQTSFSRSNAIWVPSGENAG